MALRFRGSGHFRQRLACATLSGRTIRIDDIRARDENPGLRDYEASLLRLLEKVTNGCVVEINETGAASRPCPEESSSRSPSPPNRGRLLSSAVTSWCRPAPIMHAYACTVRNDTCIRRVPQHVIGQAFAVLPRPGSEPPPLAT